MRTSVRKTLWAPLWGIVLWVAPASAQQNAAPIAVDIEWSSLGIPHVQAADERSLGYGMGYAYAQDNACLLEDEILTVRGERSELLGAEGTSSAELSNPHSDLFFRWLNNERAVADFWRAQPPAIQQLLQGYAAGFNRYLREATGSAAPACRGAAWFRPISERDLVRLTRRMLVEGGLGQFSEALATAAPPGSAKPAVPRAAWLERFQTFASSYGSNAIAVGGQRTENGKGRLLGNPHFPWFGPHRFYQMHLTIPGALDVMGAALPGLPVINIGFNRNLAWTHTVDKASHFTLHRLRLDAKNPQQYVVDGKAQALRKTPIKIKVRGRDGKLTTHTHTIYESHYGPLIAIEGELAWTRAQAYALQDANLGNTRVLSQWHAMNAAPGLAEFRAAVQNIRGIPWVNTLAVDDRGQALYMGVSVIPHIPAERLPECLDQALMGMGIAGVEGSRSFCDWQQDAGAPLPGTVAAARLPVLLRKDFVQNSNDSAWMSNPAAPLVGYSPLISRADAPLGLRSRFALERLMARKGAVLSEDFLRSLVTDNRVYLADLVLDDLLAFCKTLPKDSGAGNVCQSLAAWDRSASLNAGPGQLYFEAFGSAFLELGAAWRVAFDPADPLHTPRGLAWQNSEVASKLKEMLEDVAKRAEGLGVNPRTRWAEIQGVTRGASFIPIPGGDGALGVYNAIQSAPAQSGRREVYSGSSYIQLVSFDAQGPVAQGVLSFSQASEPSSPHARDQTELFSHQKWHSMPFTAEQIDADPPVRKLQLRE